jgi:crotonobetainyl-CoA:carnitine CoA-transferase CaiB-like acyl-CoA transferase
VVGILAALHHRDKTGQGQFIDMALLDSQVAVLANQGLNYLVGGKVPQRLGNAHPNIVPYQVFETADGHMIVAVGNDRQFTEYSRIIGVEADAKFATNRARVEGRAELIPLLAAAMKKQTTAQWVAAFEVDAIPCGPINTIDQVFADPQTLARGLQVGQTRNDGVQVPGIANPIVLSETPIEYDRAAPGLGQDTDKILRELLGVEDVQGLRNRNVIS